MFWLLVASAAIVFSLETLCQDIMFPTDKETIYLSGNSNNQEVTARVPLKVEGRCPLNMLLYPGDGDASDWECDCEPGFLYFPLNDSCHRAFTQGPCSPQHYVVLPRGEAVPSCVKNPCGREGLLPYKGSCYEPKRADGPCGPKKILNVNETTFQVECQESDVGPWMIIDVPKPACPSGSRRNALGQCRQEI